MKTECVSKDNHFKMPGRNKPAKQNLGFDKVLTKEMERLNGKGKH